MRTTSCFPRYSSRVITLPVDAKRLKRGASSGGVARAPFHSQAPTPPPMSTARSVPMSHFRRRRRIAGRGSSPPFSRCSPFFLAFRPIEDPFASEGQALTFISCPQHWGTQCPALTMRISCLHFSQTYRSVSLGMASSSPRAAADFGEPQPTLVPPGRTPRRGSPSRRPHPTGGSAHPPCGRTPDNKQPWLARPAPLPASFRPPPPSRSYRPAPQGCLCSLTLSCRRDGRAGAPGPPPPGSRSSSPC